MKKIILPFLKNKSLLYSFESFYTDSGDFNEYRDFVNYVYHDKVGLNNFYVFQ